jgi:sugar lactone lactonase YvrE
LIKQTGKIHSAILTGLVLTVAAGAGLIAFFLFDASGTQTKIAPEYSYDLERYAKIDPALILYRQTAEPIETGLTISQAVALDTEGRIYVAGDRKIVIYEPNRNIRKVIELEREPTCIQMDVDGGLLVCLTDHLVFMDVDGAIRDEWAAPAENALLTSIATDRDNVYVADAVNKVVWRYNRKGEILNRIGKKDLERNISGIVVPSPYFDIAAYPDGLLRVVNPGRHWIEAYTPDGHREWHWGSGGVEVTGFSGCCNPVALAVLPDGGFVTCEKGLVRVKVYDADGEFAGVVAGPEQLGWMEPLRVCKTPEECKSKGFDVAVDAAGRIYVLDTLKNMVKIFEKNEQ